ncbi:MAG TPA: polysaccharide biosynthesis/export family protein [Planctomycetaceae bacterium]|nr:polysaccharide biosynthesis/export family protein [Planctomycetaceae bacterium]
MNGRPMIAPNAYRWLMLLGLVLPLMTGCAAFRPIHGVPARYVPDEFKGATRSGKRTIDLSLMRQRPNAVHLVDSGDLLSIYIEGVLPRREEQPQVYFPQNSDVPPTVGYPIPVREDGTISLPLVGIIPVRGQSVMQVEDAIRRAYTVDKQFLQPGRIFVALQRPRHYRVLVIRQEATSDVTLSQAGTLNMGALKRGTGKVVNLPVYKNDVLNALAESGGLPGLDAENAIYVIRSGTQAAVPVTPTQSGPGPWMPPAAAPPVTMPDGRYAPAPQIRGQSPDWNVDPNADYRANVRTAGWTTPAGEVAPIQQLQYQPPAYQPPVYQPANLQPVQYASPYAATTMPMQPIAPIPAMQPPQWTPTPDPIAAPVPQQPQPDWTTVGDGWTAGDLGPSLEGRRVIRIPVRLGPGENVDITPEDVILHDGDIVFIESRETEVFYTGGLLGGGQYTLPRDYDLDVLGAIAIAQGRSSGGGGSRATQSQGGQSALNSDVSISASQVIILRPLCDGTQLTVQVDLYEALLNPNERIVIQPGDYILLQYTRPEAVLAFIERHLLEGALFGVAAAQLNSGGN